MLGLGGNLDRIHDDYSKARFLYTHSKLINEDEATRESTNP